MRRLRIEHRTGYRYDAVANASYNEARMLPAADPGQIVLASRLDIRADRRDGAATRRGVTSRHEYLDYYGTRVTSFEVLASHDALSLVASSLVEVRPTPDGGEDACTWERLAAVGQSTVALSEQLLPTERTAPPVEVARMAEEIAASAATPAQAAHEILDRVGDAMEYVQGVTGVATTAAQAWAKRKGVCQDITHIALGALRRAGIPARYVSGYLQPKTDAAIGETVAGESHAWVEWFDGVWHGYDPTNRVAVGDRHVRVGRGRDYGDVAPLRGVFSGEGASHLFVSVGITREA
ncbi:MAG: Transglutaminase family protein [Pseudoclavibacter caeni]|jgi:transglutaminase-like putative cysteine protease